MLNEKDLQKVAFLDGFIKGLQSYAHWKDGVQYVGTCGTTLKDAIAVAERGEFWCFQKTTHENPSKQKVDF